MEWREFKGKAHIALKSVYPETLCIVNMIRISWPLRIFIYPLVGIKRKRATAYSLRDMMRHSSMNTTMKYDHMVRPITDGAESYIKVAGGSTGLVGGGVGQGSSG